jgi:hypothetical protein
MILILRGHIRTSFDDDKLYNLIKNIYNNNSNIEIYISTFNILQSNISWRYIEEIKITVNEEYIYNYFKDLVFLIKKILIIDDKKIDLIGNLLGKLCKSNMPIIGWKRYWYCKNKILEYINNLNKNKNEFVINCRFDIFCNSNNFNENEILKFIEDNKNRIFIHNKFIKDKYRHGIDNIYIGNINTQYKLSNKFFFNLDSIEKKYYVIKHQEMLVYIENFN